MLMSFGSVPSSGRPDLEVTLATSGNLRIAERTRWAREIHDETVQGLGALRLKLANARDLHDQEALRTAVAAVLDGLGVEIEGLRHLITELRPAALDGLARPGPAQLQGRRQRHTDQARRDVFAGYYGS